MYSRYIMVNLTRRFATPRAIEPLLQHKGTERGLYVTPSYPVFLKYSTFRTSYI